LFLVHHSRQGGQQPGDISSMKNGDCVRLLRWLLWFLGLQQGREHGFIEFGQCVIGKTGLFEGRCF